MINSVSSSVGVNFTQAGSTRHVVSPEQKTAIEQILSKYDASSITSEDAQSITDSFKEMGVKPSRDLRETIESAGFDADEIRELSSGSNIQGMPPPPSPKKDDTADISVFEELLAELLESSFNNQDEEKSNLIDEYGTKYSNLTDEAKVEAKNIMTEFKDMLENSESGSGATNTIKHSMNALMSNANNYNRVNIYA